MRTLLTTLVGIFCSCFSGAYGQSDFVGSGRAVYFDGLDDFVNLGNIYDDVQVPLSISAWIFVPNGSSGTFPIFHSQDDLTTNTYNGFVMIVSTTPHIGLTLGDGQGGFSPDFRRSKAARFGSILGRWINVAVVVRTNVDMDIYLNGFNIGGNYEGFSNFPMNSFAPNAIAKIGSWWSNNQLFFFKGMIDELRIWNRALTETEIRRDMCITLSGTEPGLIGYWDFNETQGNVVFDKSPNGFHGQLVGNPTRVFSGAPIGDVSTYLYTDNWSGRKLTQQAGNYVFEIDNVMGANDGVQIYQVNSSPSQVAGLDPGIPNQPYFGVFLASQTQPGTFTAKLKWQNELFCSAFVRADNREAFWTQRTGPFISHQARGEFSRGFLSSLPSFTLGPDKTSCVQNDVHLNTGLSIPGLSFLWSTNETTPSIVVSSPGQYVVSVTDGCKVSRDTIQVVFFSAPEQNFLGPDLIACDKAETLLIAPKPYGHETIVWDDGSTQFTRTVSISGLFSAKLENACGAERDSISVEFLMAPKPFEIESDHIVCNSPETELTLPSLPDQVLITWDDGSSNITRVIHRSGAYWVKLENVCGVQYDTAAISFQQSPKSFTLGPDQIICGSSDVVLTLPDVTRQMKITWDDGSADTTRIVTSAGTFWVKIENACGEVSDSINLETLEIPKDFYPNVLTPNNDGKNDRFVLPGDLQGVFSIKAFNRWGGIGFLFSSIREYMGARKFIFRGILSPF